MSTSIVLAILVTSLATFSSRLLGAPNNLEENVANDVTKIASTMLVDI